MARDITMADKSLGGANGDAANKPRPRAAAAAQAQQENKGHTLERREQAKAAGADQETGEIPPDEGAATTTTASTATIATYSSNCPHNCEIRRGRKVAVQISKSLFEEVIRH